MVLILNQRYTDTPAILTELVFCVSMHISVEAVDKCVEQTADFKVTMNDLKNQ